MSSVTVKFDKIPFKKTRQGKCPVCHKKVVRSMTVNLTSNPFNGWATREELRASADQEFARWKPDFTHEKCANAKKEEGYDS